MKASDVPIVVEQEFGVPIAAVWSAVTEIDQMRQWYFDNIPAFRAEVGFETQFNVYSDGRDFLHLWKVTEVVPLEKITYDWRYEKYAGDSWVSFELFERGETTKLRLTHCVREDFAELKSL